MSYSQELTLALELAERTQTQLLNWYAPYHHQKSHRKQSGELVTPADTEINQLIIEALAATFPDDAIISEESPDKPGTNGRTWFIDPIDGTTNFTHGLPEFATCIGFGEGSSISMGVINIPATKTTLFADHNGPLMMNGKPYTPTSGTDRPMILVCGGHSSQGKQQLDKLFTKLHEKNMHVRFIASAGIELARVATGAVDACIITEARPFDLAAGVALVNAAGGITTDTAGTSWKTDHHSIIASLNYDHEQLVSIMQSLS